MTDFRDSTIEANSLPSRPMKRDMDTRSCDDGKPGHVPAAPALPNKKRQRSQSRDRAMRTGCGSLWGDGDHLSLSRNGTDGFVLNRSYSSSRFSRSPLEPVLISIKNSNSLESPTNEGRSKAGNDVQQRITVASCDACDEEAIFGSVSASRRNSTTSCSDSLFSVEGEKVDEIELGHRISFLSSRGFDDCLLQMMHESVYDDDDLVDHSAASAVALNRSNSPSGFDMEAEDGAVTDSSGGGVTDSEDTSEWGIYVPCEPMYGDGSKDVPLSDFQ